MNLLYTWFPFLYKLGYSLFYLPFSIVLWVLGIKDVFSGIVFLVLHFTLKGDLRLLCILFIQYMKKAFKSELISFNWNMSYSFGISSLWSK